MHSPLDTAAVRDPGAAPDTTSLGDLQRMFHRAVLSGDAGEVEPLIRSDGIPAARRVQIYGNNSRAGFLATLASTFPVIERLGGADWFQQSAREYQREFPSRSGDLQYVGARFSDYLRSRFAGTAFEYFCDVARLEWAYQEVLTAADSAPLDPAVLGAVAADDHERMVFNPRPAVRLIESAYPILTIWQVNRAGGDPRAGLPAGGVPLDTLDATVSLDAGPSRVLVIRRADLVELREIAAPTAILLNQFLSGAPFAIAAAAVADAHSDAAIAGSLRDLIQFETIRGYRL